MGAGGGGEKSVTAAEVVADGLQRLERAANDAHRTIDASYHTGMRDLTGQFEALCTDEQRQWDAPTLPLDVVSEPDGLDEAADVDDGGRQ